MAKYNFKDPKGFKTCRKCKVQFVLSKQHFHENHGNRDGFQSYCKYCCNADRRNRIKNKLSHKIHRRCLHCQSIFYVTLADINRAKKKNSDRKYCSIHCYTEYSPPKGTKKGGMRGSWNGARRGSNNPNAKLNEDMVKSIKLLLQQGHSSVDISKLYNISSSQVSGIKNGRIWTHV